MDAGVTSALAWLVRELGTIGRLVWLWFVYSFDGGRHPLPGTLDLAAEVSFWPHGLIAATAFTVCLVLVTQSVAANEAAAAGLSPMPTAAEPWPEEGTPSYLDRQI